MSSSLPFSIFVILVFCCLLYFSRSLCLSLSLSLSFSQYLSLSFCLSSLHALLSTAASEAAAWRRTRAVISHYKLSCIRFSLSVGQKSETVLEGKAILEPLKALLRFSKLYWRYIGDSQSYIGDLSKLYWRPLKAICKDLQRYIQGGLKT